MKHSVNIATSSFILKNYLHLLNGNNESAEKIGSDELMIPSFSEDILISLCNSAINILKQKNQTLISISLPTIVIGDLHGNLHDLIRFTNAIDDIFSNKILFLGDYVDRGQYQIETITLLLALRIEYPDNIFLIRGNHEFTTVNSQGGFKDEILQSNYSESLFDKFNEVFSYLPIAAIINDKIFCVHGGLSPLFQNIKQIETEFTLPIKNIYKNSKKKIKHRLSDSIGFQSQNRRPTPLGISDRKHRYSDSIDVKQQEENMQIIKQPSKKLTAETKSKSFIFSKLPSLNAASNDQIASQKDTFSPPNSPLRNGASNIRPIPPLKVPPMQTVSNRHLSPSKLLHKMPIPQVRSIPNSPLRSNFLSPRVGRPSEVELDELDDGDDDVDDDDQNNTLMLTDLMWSDPSNLTDFYLPSNRGSGWYFGFIATSTFLQKNDMKMIVRGHESIKKGVQTSHENRVVTVYSSSSSSQGGVAGCVVFDTRENVNVFKLEPITVIQRSDAKFFTPVLKKYKKIESLSAFPSSMKLSKSKMYSARQSNKNVLKESISQTLDDTYSIDKQ